MEKLLEDAKRRIEAALCVQQMHALPVKSISGGLVRVKLFSSEAGLLNISFLELSGMMGSVRAEFLVLTPLLQDAPAAMCGFMHAPGKDSIHLDALDTLLTPSPLWELQTVRDRSPLESHTSSLSWYEHKKLSPSICVSAAPRGSAVIDLFSSWVEAWIGEVKKAPQCAPAAKRQRTEELVEAIAAEREALSAVYGLLGKKNAQKIFHDAFLPGE